ncbi:MAG: AEC family transporter [Pseudomonadota bacterium]
MSTFTGLLLIVLPVFLLVGCGYATVRFRAFPDKGIDALIAFATNIAVPALLFRAIYTLDLGAALDAGHLMAFYGGALVCFVGATLVSRMVWRRRPGESVAVGFSALFSNSVLLGLPIFERAFGAAAMEPVFALIAFHAPFCYLVGIMTMEFLRRDGLPIRVAMIRSAKAMFKNGLMLGIALGFLFNIGGVPVPGPVSDVIDMLAAAALPVALFGLGGVLTRYRMRAEIGEALMVSVFSLIAHPLLAYVVAAHVFALDDGFVRSAVLIAAMPPGVNGYIFAAMYDRAVGTAASTVLLATALSVFTTTLWLGFLGGGAFG